MTSEKHHFLSIVGRKESTDKSSDIDGVFNIQTIFGINKVFIDELLSQGLLSPQVSQ